MVRMQQKHLPQKHLPQKLTDFFWCPVCKSSMHWAPPGSIVCANRHCFDIAKKGYVNFLNKPVRDSYDSVLFTSRRTVCQSGLFKPLTDKLSEIIAERFAKNVNILDAGCGEGSHLAAIGERFGSDCVLAGFDIAKEAVKLASGHHSGGIWCVADLANIPFGDGRFDAVTNILSPGNYAEFKRVLKKDGLLLKVVPGSEYLQELRSLFYQGTEKETYSPQEVLTHFEKRFSPAETVPLRYQASPNAETLEHLVGMTPLSWHIPADQKNIALPFVTMDFLIILGTLQS